MVDKLIDTQADYIARLYRDIETNIIVEIAKSIERHGKITGTTEYNLKRLQAIIGLDREILQEISRISGKPLEEIVKSIEAIGIGSIDFEMYRTAYDRGLLLNSIDNIALEPMILAMTDKTTGIIRSVETKAREHTLKEFKRAIDTANIQVQLGVKTPRQATVEAVKDIARQGITSATYLRDGKEVNMSLEPYVFRVVRTEMVQSSNEVSNQVGQELGVEHWYVTQHIGARDKGIGYENHEKWQGQVYTTEELETECGYQSGDMLGLGGYNCRHRHYGFIKGISVPPPPKIDTDINARAYDLSQTQRRYERSIRESKRVIKALEQLDNEDAIKEIVKEKKLLRTRQGRVRQLVADNQDVLRRDYSREQIYS